MHAVNNDLVCVFTDSFWDDMEGESKEQSHRNQTRSSIIPLNEEDCVPYELDGHQTIPVATFHSDKQWGDNNQGAAQDFQLSQLQNLNLSLPESSISTNNAEARMRTMFDDDLSVCTNLHNPKQTFAAAPAQAKRSYDDFAEHHDHHANEEDMPTAADLVQELMGFPLFEDGGRTSGSSSDDADASSVEGRFRSYQSGQWSARFAELVEYKKKMGHCLVPHNYEANLPLARWVKRQRCQYRRMTEGQHSTISQDRKRALDEIGFVWDFQGDAWEEKLTELRAYRDRFGNANVPYHFEENPKLAVWVKCQRRQYKLFMEGKHSSMTHERIQDLENLGFRWELRSYNKKRRLS